MNKNLVNVRNGVYATVYLERRGLLNSSKEEIIEYLEKLLEENPFYLTDENNVVEANE